MWVEGIQRIVCGVSDATTCQDVVYALAHATGKTGRFTLVEKWRNNERLLPPHEHPLRVLSKWGEYASDVQLVLRRSNLDPKSAPDGGGSGTRTTPDPFGSFAPQPGSNKQGSKVVVTACTNGHLKKSLTFSAGSAHHPGEPPAFREPPRERAGATKGLSQQQLQQQQVAPSRDSETTPFKGPTEPSNVNSTAVRDGSREVSDGSCAGHHWPNRSAPNGHANNVGSAKPTDGAVRTCKVPDPTTGHTGHYRTSENPGPPPGPRIMWPPDPTGQAGARTARPEQNGTDTDLSTGKSPNWSTSQDPIASSHGGGTTVLLGVRQAVGARLSEPPPSSNRPQPANAPFGSGVGNNAQYRSPTTHSYHSSPPVSSSPSAPASCTVLVNNKEPLGPGVRCPAPNYQSPARPTGPNPVPIHLGTPKSRRNLLSEFKRHDLEEELRDDSLLGRSHQERVVYDARYRDLVRLVNLQREKLSHQQADLTQYDAEISYWEEKQKDHQRQIEVIEREIQRSEFSGRDIDEEVAQLDKLHLDDELDIGRQQEKMLQSELTLLRSKLANCETELLQCKNKIRLLMDEISEDKRWLSKEEDDRKQKEMSILNDIEDLQRDIQDVIKSYDSKIESCEKLEADVRRLEAAIMEKKKQIENLVQEIKEANLESLTFTPSEEIRHLLEGSAHKGPGSSRKIVGSPRQLENAVPTSKNPHGVWV